MKKAILGSILSAALFAFGASAETVTGYISESHCGAAHNSPSAANTACIKKCLQGGSDPVIVSKDQVIKIDPASKDKAVAFAGQEVDVAGTVHDGMMKIDSISATK